MSGPVTVEPLAAPPVGAPAGLLTDRPRAAPRGGDVTLTLARVASMALTAIASAVVARSLGPHGYGLFAAGAAVASVMVLGKVFGADALYLRGSIDERTLRRRSIAAGFANLAVVAIAAIAWPGLSWTARGCELLMGAAWSITNARSPWLVLPARRLAFETRARREVIAAVLSYGSVIAFAVTLQRPLLAACGLLVGAVLTTAASWPGLRREPSTTSATSGDGSVRAGLSFTAIEATFVAYFALDGAMIAAMRPAVDAGMYRVAYAFVIAAAVVPVALNADVLRVRLWQLSGEHRAQALRKAVWLTAIAAVAVTLCFELLGGFGERLFFGPKFTAAIPIIHILGLAMPFHYANSVASNLLVGQGRMRTVLRVQGAMLLVNIAGNLWLIPSHGPRGAAVTTVATEALGLVVYLLVLRRSRLLADRATTLTS